MELPHVGEHCSFNGCNQLDYLPITCTLCNKKFCNEHHRYEDHSCPESYKVDVKVPICPLCEKPVPSKRGLAPDLAVNEHLENNCQSKNKKIYRNRCSVAGCKVKELVSIQCDSCIQNYCLRHRHTTDHDCKGPVVARREQTLNGSIFKNWMRGDSSNSNSKKFESNQTTKKSTVPPRSNGILQVSPTVREANVNTFQGNMSEEEALRKAILTSQGKENATEGQSTEDEELARAIALSLEVQNRQTTSRTKSSDCSIS